MYRASSWGIQSKKPFSAAVALTLASSYSYADEHERAQPLFTPPENARTVWFLRARHVASEFGLDRDAARKLTQTYISARQEHLDKVKARALPKTFESFP